MSSQGAYERIENMQHIIHIYWRTGQSFDESDIHLGKQLMCVCVCVVSNVLEMSPNRAGAQTSSMPSVLFISLYLSSLPLPFVVVVVVLIVCCCCCFCVGFVFVLFVC